MFTKYVYKAASLLASAALIGSTAGIAVAATYPSPFVKNGAADVAVVWGANAAPTDLVAVTDITTHLQSELAKQTAISSTGSTVSGGDFVLLAKSSDKMNLGEKITNVFGATVDNGDLPTLLADGTYTNDENTDFNYEQTITLAPLTLTFFADSAYKNKEPTIGYNVTSNSFVMNYTLDFTTDAESDVSSGDLVDIETTDVTILGKKYYVLDADNSTLKLTLLDSATTITLTEGETQTATLGSKTYDVSIAFVGSATQARIKVGDQTTDTLAEGGTYKLKDGTYVGIRSILYNSKDAGISQVEISLGVGKLEVTNTQDIELNDNSISGMKGYIYRGSVTGGKETLDKITLEWKTDEDVYLTAANSLTMPGFKAVKLSMGEFVKPKAEVIKVSNDGTDVMSLTTPIKDGSVTIDLLGALSDGNFTRIGGDDTDERLLTAATGTSSLIFNDTAGSRNRYFVASYNTSRDTESYLLRFATFGNSTDEGVTVDVEKYVGGEWKDQCTKRKAGRTCKTGNVELTINFIRDYGSDEWVNFSGSSGVSFDRLFTDGGLTINLPVAGTGIGVGNINLTQSNTTAGHSPSSFYLYFTEEDKDGNIGAGAQGYVVLDAQSDGDVEVASFSGAESHKEIEDENNIVGHLASALATKVRRIGDTSSQRESELTYYGSEAYAETYITDTVASITSGTAGGAKLGSVSVTDAEAASVSTKNLIVVGGSCVNTVAAELLGSTAPLCGADWEAKTGVGSGQFLVQTFSRTGGKVATLVAGYNAGDTTNAAKYLTTQTAVDTTAGKKYKGSTATSAELVTI